VFYSKCERLYGVENARWRGYGEAESGATVSREPLRATRAGAPPRPALIFPHHHLALPSSPFMAFPLKTRSGEDVGGVVCLRRPLVP